MPVLLGLVSFATVKVTPTANGVKPPHPRPLSPENGGEGSHDVVTWASTHAAIARSSLRKKS